ncbi:MAG: O-antigen ligase family protein [Candidatus Eremiobacteraeota bacterium]|nr:O-antigen ligase family protein [Candidatus Eremiobacteraeota bacterium]
MRLRSLIAVAVCAVTTLILAAVMSGSTTKIAAAALVVLAPIAALVAWKRPMLFPYAAYAFLVPFDNLLAMSSFGTGAKLLGLLAGAAFLLWTLRRRQAVAPPASLILWALLLAWIAVSLLWTSSFADGMRDFQTMLQIVLLYAVISMTPIDTDDLKWLLRSMICGGIAAAIFGLYVFHHQNPIEAELQRDFGRVAIRFGENAAIDVNHFANALLLPIAALLVVALNERRIVRKVVFGGGLAIMLSALYQTQSREALLGLAAMLVYLIFVSRKRLQLLFVTVLGLLFIAFDPAMWQRFAEASSTGGAGRTSIWGVGIEAFKSHWAFGSGAGSFLNAYDQAYVNVFQRFSVGWDRDPHNLLIHYSVELGIIGVLLVVACWVTQFRMLSGIARGSPLSEVRAVAIAALIGLSITAMFIDLFTYKYVWLLFAFIAQLRALARAHPALSARPVAAGEPERLRIARLWNRTASTHAS